MMFQKMQMEAIKNLLSKNYKIEPDLIDLESEIDSKLTLRENWSHIKRRYVKPTALSSNDIK